jgi:hypothetical protein
MSRGLYLGAFLYRYDITVVLYGDAAVVRYNYLAY